jgi:hypothetical protein
MLVAFCRLVLISIGAFSIWWGVTTLPIFWRDSRVEQVADRVLDDEEFKPEVLEALLADADSGDAFLARPQFLTSVAIIRLKLVELAGGEENAKPNGPLLDQLARSVRRALTVAPADSYLWLALFIAKIGRDDPGKPDFSFLKMSYLVGPHEGWVAALRNYIALGIGSDLPPDLAEAAVTEFKDLVASAYYETALGILTGPGWPIHELLLRRLEDAPEEARNQFGRLAYQRGYDFQVPGFNRPEARPWQWRMQRP